MPEADTELIVRQEDGLAILQLNRPQRLNALSPEILRRLEIDIPHLLSMPEIRALLLTGTGRAFCAGGDVDSMSGSTDGEATLSGMRRYHPWLTSLWRTDKIVITAINGVAAGGGFGLAMMGDLVIASDTAWFKSAFSTLGAAADYGLGFTLPRALGTARAADILFSDRKVGAQEALDLGLLSRILPAKDFAQQALAFAHEMARLPRAAQLTKRLLRQGQHEAFAQYLEMEAQVQAEAFQSEDFREGVAAFLERRRPHFRGC